MYSTSLLTFQLDDPSKSQPDTAILVCRCGRCYLYSWLNARVSGKFQNSRPTRSHSRNSYSSPVSELPGFACTHIYIDEGTDLTTSCIMAQGDTHMTQPDSETNFCMSQFWSPHVFSAHYTSSSKFRQFLTNAFLCLRHKKSMGQEKSSPKVISVPKL